MEQFLDIQDDSFDLFSGADGTGFMSGEFDSFDGDEYSNFLTEEQMRAKGMSEDEIQATLNSSNYKEEVKNASTKTNKQFDAQKFADTIVSLGSAGASIFGTVKAFQDPKKHEKKKSLREACGMKMFQNRDKYNKCVEKYNSATTFTTKSGDGGGNNGGGGNNNEGMSTTTKVIIGVLVAGVLGFIGYKVLKGKGEVVAP